MLTISEIAAKVREHGRFVSSVEEAQGMGEAALAMAEVCALLAEEGTEAIGRVSLGEDGWLDLQIVDLSRFDFCGCGNIKDLDRPCCDECSWLFLTSVGGFRRPTSYT